MNTATLPLDVTETGRPPLASYRANLDRCVKSALEEEIEPFIDPEAYKEIIDDLAKTGDQDLANRRIASHWQHIRHYSRHVLGEVTDHITTITLAYWKLHRAEKFSFTLRKP